MNYTFKKTGTALIVGLTGALIVSFLQSYPATIFFIGNLIGMWVYIILTEE